MTPTGGEEARRLGRLVKVERQRQGWYQRDLAREADVSRNTITELENGRTTGPKVLPKVIRALGLPPDILDVVVDPPEMATPGVAPPLLHLSDAQVSSEAMRLIAELAARLAARPVATAVPEPGTPGVLSAVDDRRDDPPDEAGHTGQ